MSLLICVYGIVQGVGFRPFVSRLANRLALKGSVANKGSFVEIHLQGGKEALDEFCKRLKTDAPPRASILKMDVREIREKTFSYFQIIESLNEAGDIFVSPDIAVCEHCKKELFDPKDRRYLHPFINCTACGPRLTVMESMPYDRERTTMAEFPMCPECRSEYTDPATRRYDAQPVCCNQCGPEVYLLNRPERGAAAISEVRRALMEVRIAAVKGIGGFHLCCDAHNAEAAARLRRLKARPAKPFALMFRDLETVRKHCEITPEEEELLTGHQKPIILLKKRENSDLPDVLAPGNPKLGIMLPYAPIQLLLFQYPDSTEMTDALVMTSGNVSGAPICRSDEDALNEIANYCDLILSHNRKILIRADDSVMDFSGGKPYMIRRSRGYAPLPLMLSGNLHGEVLGIGGELKNTFCLGKDSLFYPSPYIGDMADERTVAALKESLIRMENLLRIRPAIAACDLHPRYNTTMITKELGLPVMKIQHHYAHILSCMAENDFLQDEVIGISFDGTGYGTDGTIWGGELLRCSFRGFERCGFIRPFRHVGGDLASREGWRIGASMLDSIYGNDAAEIAQRLGLCTKQEFQLVSAMAKNGINTIRSTSAGRLFDAVSAILGIRRSSTFEGEASMALQFAAECDSGAQTQLLNCELAETDSEGKIVLNTNRLVAEITGLKLQGADNAFLARAFHMELGRMIATACGILRKQTSLNTVALSGGVFQNTLLLEICRVLLEFRGFRVLKHSMIPPNDGGIALGQAAAAMMKLQNNGKE